ncbi:hypothetical protein EVAR_49818_1 [Eumeta japonica]|uniref:Uncharacterized protein n=1 Tax=Eumeta variegata TaxID=151549 RepID=A0A4C1XRQ3_EUMVA|nr:hypothetical protein EVAR_49818_1 [Eumeta japonica]
MRPAARAGQRPEPTLSKSESKTESEPTGIEVRIDRDARMASVRTFAHIYRRNRGQKQKTFNVRNRQQSSASPAGAVAADDFVETILLGDFSRCSQGINEAIGDSNRQLRSVLRPSTTNDIRAKVVARKPGVYFIDVQITIPATIGFDDERRSCQRTHI